MKPLQWKWAAEVGKALVAHDEHVVYRIRKLNDQPSPPWIAEVSANERHWEQVAFKATRTGAKEAVEEFRRDLAS